MTFPIALITVGWLIISGLMISTSGAKDLGVARSARGRLFNQYPDKPILTASKINEGINLTAGLITKQVSCWLLWLRYCQVVENFLPMPGTD